MKKINKERQIIETVIHRFYSISIYLYDDSDEYDSQLDDYDSRLVDLTNDEIELYHHGKLDTIKDGNYDTTIDNQYQNGLKIQELLEVLNKYDKDKIANLKLKILDDMYDDHDPVCCPFIAIVETRLENDEEYNARIAKEEKAIERSKKQAESYKAKNKAKAEAKLNTLAKKLGKTIL